MSPESRELAQAWLAKARSDLSTARILIEGNQKHFDTGSYHCQQAAEKALKGWLTACEAPVPKTHFLVELLERSISFDDAFSPFRKHCETLGPLAHEFRYPGDIMEPALKDAQQALALAEEIYRFCEQQLGTLESGG